MVDLLHARLSYSVQTDRHIFNNNNNHRHNETDNLGTRVQTLSNAQVLSFVGLNSTSPKPPARLFFNARFTRPALPRNRLCVARRYVVRLESTRLSRSDGRKPCGVYHISPHHQHHRISRATRPQEIAPTRPPVSSLMSRMPAASARRRNPRNQKMLDCWTGGGAAKDELMTGRLGKLKSLHATNDITETLPQRSTGFCRTRNVWRSRTMQTLVAKQEIANAYLVCVI